jgi:ribosomal protein S27E
MGDRYFLTMNCKKCGYHEEEVYFAPTCGFTKWQCRKCGKKVDLVKHTGITEEMASNKDIIEALCKTKQEV